MGGPSYGEQATLAKGLWLFHTDHFSLF